MLFKIEREREKRENMASLKFRGNVRRRKKYFVGTSSRARPLRGIEFQPDRFTVRVDSPNEVKEQVDMSSPMDHFNITEVLTSRSLGRPVARRSGFSTRNLRDIVFKEKLEDLRDDIKYSDEYGGPQNKDKRKKYLRSFPKPYGKVYYSDVDEYVRPDEKEVDVLWRDKKDDLSHYERSSFYDTLPTGRSENFTGLLNLPNSILQLEQQGQTGDGRFFKISSVPKSVRMGPFVRKRHAHR